MRHVFSTLSFLLGLHTAFAAVLPRSTPTDSSVGLVKRDNALIDVFADIALLSSSQCPAGLVGVVANVVILDVLHVCLCISVLAGIPLPLPGQRACPTCTASHSHAICTASGCGCECSEGHYATAQGTCEPITTCQPPFTLTHDSTTGRSTCACLSPYVGDNTGGCALPASPRLRAAKKSNVPDERTAPSSDERCEVSETACPMGTTGWECLDLSSSLDSCGTCGNSCEDIPGASSTVCRFGRCEISSCLPGWNLYRGTCIKRNRLLS